MKAAVPFKEVFEEFMEDPEFKEEYEKTRPRFKLTQQIVAARCKKGITQKELARMVGMKRSAISRIESGKTNPTYDTLYKLSQALDCTISI